MDKVFDLERLQIPSSTKKDLQKFCEELMLLKKVISIIVIGSAVTPEFSSLTSDVNVLFIFSELELKDLECVIQTVNKWWKRRRISPRFISQRNLTASLKYFPIDFWTMQNNYCVIYGGDVFSKMQIQKEDLLWQLKHEIKGLRMRVKQQFWRTGGNIRFAKVNLITDFNTVMYLLKVLFYLKNFPPTQTIDQLIGQTKNELKIENDFAETILLLKRDKVKIEKKNMSSLFDDLMNYIRRIDEASEEIKI